MGIEGGAGAPGEQFTHAESSTDLEVRGQTLPSPTGEVPLSGEVIDAYTAEEAKHDLEIIDGLMDEARARGLSEEGIRALDASRRVLERHLEM